MDFYRVIQSQRNPNRPSPDRPEFGFRTAIPKAGLNNEAHYEKWESIANNDYIDLMVSGMEFRIRPWFMRNINSTSLLLLEDGALADPNATNSNHKVRVHLFEPGFSQIKKVRIADPSIFGETIQNVINAPAGERHPVPYFAELSKSVREELIHYDNEEIGTMPEAIRIIYHGAEIYLGSTDNFNTVSVDHVTIIDEKEFINGLPRNIIRDVMTRAYRVRDRQINEDFHMSDFQLPPGHDENASYQAEYLEWAREMSEDR